MLESPFYQSTHDLSPASLRLEYIDLPSFDFGWHHHECCEITLITAGDGRLLAGEAACDFAASSLLVLGPDLPHAFISDANSLANNAWIIQFDPVGLNSLLELPEFLSIARLLQNMQAGLHFPTSPLTAAEFKQLARLSGVNQIARLLVLLSQLAASDDYQLIGGSLSQQPVKSRVARICSYIDRNLAQPLPLQTLASEFALSGSHLSRLFKQATGYSLNDYIIRRRIQRAAQLLVETELSISNISEQCGYQQEAFFSRTFRRINGMPPGAYRKQLRDGNLK